MNADTASNDIYYDNSNSRRFDISSDVNDYYENKRQTNINSQIDQEENASDNIQNKLKDLNNDSDNINSDDDSIDDNSDSDSNDNSDDINKINRHPNQINEATDEEIKNNTINLMKKNYSYPDPSDPNIQYKLYIKRELYYNRIHERPDITENTDYSIIKDYRDNTCARAFTLHEHQGMLSNLINPDTPYKGILVFHGLGSGKCLHKKMKIYITSNSLDLNPLTLDDYSNIEIENIFHDNKTKILKVNDIENNCEWSPPKNDMYVISLDENNNKFSKKKIINLYREKINSYLRKIELENGSSIIITFIHKLLTPHGWTCHLNINNYVFIYDPKLRNSFSRIINIELVRYDDYVYDLEIEDTHNYVSHDILCHNSCVGVAIAEKFKNMVQKYNTKIYILVPGPILKESWRYHLLFCTGETYKKYHDRYTYVDDAEKNRQNKQALAQALQYYKIMSYRSFYKRVLGEKIVEKKVTKDNRTKTTYRKTKEGDFERDIAIDRIYNLNNTIIIVDEAHNLTGNAYGKALEKVIQNSMNLKIVLMSATPMKNLGSDIVKLINFLRPIDDPMIHDKIFNSHKNHLMDFRQGGLEYFKNMINGYVSHVRGSDPLTFAKRVDKGVIPNGLTFTNVIRCTMLDFQRTTYNTTIKESEDALDRASEAVANMAFPGLSKDRTKLVGYYGREGLNIVKEQLKTSGDILNKKIGEYFFEGKEDTELIYLSNDNKTITGKIYKMPYLKNFSIKFYEAVKKISRLVMGKRGAKTAFVYSNLVKVGIDTFQEILLQNGYLEFQEDTNNYQINDDTLCYYCGKPYKNHSKLNRLYRSLMRINIDTIMNKEPEDVDQYAGSNSNSNTNTKKKGKKKSISIDNKADTSNDYEEYNKFSSIPAHKFYPATFMAITGKSTEEKAEILSEDKKKILDNVFNSIENKEGKYIKLILGSKVMNEGISMKNVGEVHILDVYFNLGKVDQVVGRAIRWCSHYKLMSETNVFPEVKVYKYVVALDDEGIEGLSSEEELYKKAELKYILIKKLERAMKERAFDCPLNMHGNIFSEEVAKYENCDMHGDNKCPAICDYQKCYYKCDDPILNYEYYDPKRKLYKLVKKSNLDYSTFTHNLAESEIEYAKNKIKEMYIINAVYTLKDIIEYVKSTFDEEKRDLFDEFFVFKALYALLPITENDFNNFKDTIVDKNNTQGYLIYRDEYYIFQPFNQNENVPLYYRINNMQDINYELSLYNYLKNSEKYKKIKGNKNLITKGKKAIQEEISAYNFDDTNEYYENRPEYEFVGIIDKELSRRKNKRIEEMKDVFKIRNKLPPSNDKKRGTGIPSLKGAVCATSKSKEYLEHIADILGASYAKNMTRNDLCESIEKQMLWKEKYATNSADDKYTYIRLPINHPKYKFPYNLEDRVEYIKSQIRAEIKHTFDSETIKDIIKSGEFKGMPSYKIIIKKKQQLEEYNDFFKKLGAHESKDSWTIIVE